jgi:hypothetical protein
MMMMDAAERFHTASCTIPAAPRQTTGHSPPALTALQRVLVIIM